MNKYHPMAKELLARVEKEQALRRQWPNEPDEEFFDKVRKIDKENTEFFKKFLKKFGWPQISKFGKEVAEAAWLTVQHTPDKEFRKQCLVLMKSIDASEIEQPYLARTIDRIRVLDGKKQLYGTNFTKAKDGKWQAQDIENPKNIDERRATMGLPLLAEDTKRVNES